MTVDLDPNLAKILDPDPNSMYSIWIHNTAQKYHRVQKSPQDERKRRELSDVSIPLFYFI